MRTPLWICRISRRGFLRAAAAAVAGFVSSCATLGRKSGERRFTLMTFNMLKGGTELGQPLSQSVRVIEAAGADIVVLQERDESAEPLAALLGWDWRAVNSSVAVLSRFPIESTTDYSVVVQLPGGRPAHVFGLHLEAYPYGPYDLRDDPTLTPDALVATAEATRGHQLRPVLEAAAPLAASGAFVFVAGDFNEPSHLDWSNIAAARGLHFGVAVPWPASLAAAEAGFTDSYRALHPDPVRVPGNTWTPLDAPGEVHDRIDLVYHGGRDLRPVAARIIGENPANADVTVVPYPTDHRAVAVTYAYRLRELPETLD